MNRFMLVLVLALLAVFPAAMAAVVYIGTNALYQSAVIGVLCAVMSVATLWLFIKAATVKRTELEKRYSLL